MTKAHPYPTHTESVRVITRPAREEESGPARRVLRELEVRPAEARDLARAQRLERGFFCSEARSQAFSVVAARGAVRQLTLRKQAAAHAVSVSGHQRSHPLDLYQVDPDTNDQGATVRG